MSRAESKARTRQALLDAAREVFAQKGFNAATVEEIVERAGFTRGAFYANWPDKSEIMWELAHDANAKDFVELEAALDVPVDQKMDALQQWFTRIVAPRPLHAAFNELMTQAGQTDDGRKRQAEIFAAERRSLVRVVGEIEEVLGEKLPIPLEHFAALGFAVGSGLMMQHQVDPDAVPISLLADAQAYLWFGVIAAAQSGDFSPRTGTPKPARRRRGGTRS